MATMLDPKSLEASPVQQSLDVSLVIPIYNEYEHPEVGAGDHGGDGAAPL